jgi:hypothetical protein
MKHKPTLLTQIKYFAGPGDLAEIALRLNEEEKQLGCSSPEANSCQQSGFFSLQVLQVALSSKGFHLEARSNANSKASKNSKG